MNTDAAIVGLGMLAVYLAVMAIYAFVKTYRKPPPVRDLSKDWLNLDP